MKENLHLFIQCIICWLHGLSTKYGNEPFLLKQFKKENSLAKEGEQNYEVY